MKPNKQDEPLTFYTIIKTFWDSILTLSSGQQLEETERFKT